MSYSRRQLEAFGEPLGDSVTRKEGGRIIYGGGGGGGGSTQTTVTELPEWAKPYAKESLGKAQAISETPYQAYGGERTAQFTPLQQQAFTGASQLTTAPQMATASGMTAEAANRAIGMQYNPYQTGQFGQQAGQYMSPFVEQAMAPQLREAQRASEMQRNMEQAKAVGQGAFGGSRQALVEAERQRNLGTQLGDIRDRGYQSAFDRAQQQFNTEQQLREQSRQYGAGLGLQGIQTALQGAGQLGSLGQQEFGQQKDILGLQQQYGTQQQQQVQNVLSQQYQDYLNQQRYPYQQLEFMSNLMRGTPSGTVSTLYAAPPSTTSQVAGLGTAAVGLGQMAKAKGGTVSSYADGGETQSNSPTTSAGLADLAIRSMF